MRHSSITFASNFCTRLLSSPFPLLFPPVLGLVSSPFLENRGRRLFVPVRSCNREKFDDRIINSMTTDNKTCIETRSNNEPKTTCKEVQGLCTKKSNSDIFTRTKAILHVTLSVGLLVSRNLILCFRPTRSGICCVTALFMKVFVYDGWCNLARQKAPCSRDVATLFKCACASVRRSICW